MRALNPHNLTFPASWRVDEKDGMQGGVTANAKSNELAAGGRETNEGVRSEHSTAVDEPNEVSSDGGLPEENMYKDGIGPPEEQVAEVEVRESHKLSKKEKRLKRRNADETMKSAWPLHWAAVNNEIRMLKAALSQDHANVQRLDDSGKAPLHYAAQRGHHDVAELLLNCKADIEQTDNIGRTPLYCAALALSRKGRDVEYDVEMLRWLVQQGANCVAPRACHNISKRAVLIIQELSPQAAEVPDGTGDVIGSPDKQVDEENSLSLNIVSQKETEEKKIERKEKSAPLKKMWPLHWAAYNNDLAMVEAALLEGWANVDETDDLGRTPLHCAAARNDLDVARLLLSNNASLEQTDKCGRTPLHLAAEKKKCMVFLRWLVQQGADVKAPITTHTSEQAVQRIRGLVRESSSTKIDLTGAQIDKLERDHEAAKATGEEKREKYKETIKERKDEQRTKWPLHWAAANNDLAMVEANLADGLTSVDQLDNFGRAPLHLAVNCGRIDMVELLLNCKADIELPDKSGRTPLHFAAEKQDMGILRSLVQQGANVNTPPTGHANNKGVRRILEVLQESCSTKLDLQWAQRQELEKIQAALTESESNVAVLALNLMSTNRKLKEGSDALCALQSQQTESVATLTSAETARDKFHSDLLAARKELKSAKNALREAEMVKRKENISKARNYHVGMKEASSGITVKLEKQEGEHQQEVSTLAAAHAQELEAAKDKTTELEDGLACTVCLDHPKTVCLFPCSHVCLCESCAEGWSDPCPICRAVVTMQRKVFFA
jgi:serine/threonine-protein phosphatase 6 regulatory ankyrin repeat subunit A/serine/threonine-protein phosphatase 6 regulatory ankyrin repeat subunit B